MKRGTERRNAGRDTGRGKDGASGGPDCRVYVGNLSFKMTEDIMRDFFGSCGRVLRVDFITDHTTGKFYGTAFVEFCVAEAARKALGLDGQKLLGRPIKVQTPRLISSRPRREASTAMPGVVAGGKDGSDSGAGAGSDEVKPIPGCRSVFVARLPLDIEEEELVEEFRKAGNIVNVRWVNVKPSTPVCCCFVEYDTEEAAAEAVHMFHGAAGLLRAHGQLRVNLAPDRPLKKFITPQPEDEHGGDGSYGDGSGAGADTGAEEQAPADAAPRAGPATHKVFEGDEAEDEPPVIPPPSKNRHIVFNDDDDDE